MKRNRQRNLDQFDVMQRVAGDILYSDFDEVCKATIILKIKQGGHGEGTYEGNLSDTAR